MSPRVVNLDSAHGEVRELLPWFVAGTLDGAESRLVDAHLQACAACRGELEWERQLRAANNVALPGRDVDRAFAALRVRLPAPAPTPARAPASASWRERLSAWREQMLPRPWLGWALAAQTLAIAGLAVVLVSTRLPSADAVHTYRALARPVAAEPARLVVAFAPHTEVGELRRVLLASGARIVDGPTAADAYILAVAPERLDAAVQQLRAEKSVLLVQSLEAKAGH
ncbi:MAG: zf-HC2 domain-containing protein [Proteobacteria bacterium]|uniref:zf-HC2 domain-containing protein n=1 Tax=Rudaea sp. TaxID=2136325 RepID=UPI001D56FDAF|nr:zf-HC2 domain-containing protein [Pseudomonadota bacterium]MBS0566746.1 zf-HC2 domain-containing protein [Pseudomonadota bacterium]